MDDVGRLWVAASHNHEVVGLNATGRPIARLGESQGVRGDGTPDGLLSPAGLVILGDDLYVPNLAQPRTAAGGDEAEEFVTQWNVVRIKLPKLSR
jgi:hypothetical protein